MGWNLFERRSADTDCGQPWTGSALPDLKRAEIQPASLYGNITKVSLKHNQELHGKLFCSSKSNLPPTINY